MMAAKGLLGLYRQVNPEMLKSRDRGRDAAVGLRSGDRRQQRYGEEAIGEIEGLELLEKWKEEERRRKRIEKGLDPDISGQEDSEEDDEAAWNAWNVEEEDSDDSGGWINVESDEEINISDSDDDEASKPTKKVKFDLSTLATDDKENAPINTPSEAPSTTTSKSNLATTRILTPADLAKLHELRTTAHITSQLPTTSHTKHHSAAISRPHLTQSQLHVDDALDPTSITGLSHLSAGKLTKEEKAALLSTYKKDRVEHKSKAERKKERKEELGKSTTNKEKARKKNFLMTLGKAKRKGKRSLMDTKKVLKMHVERGKRGGKRGNR